MYRSMVGFTMDFPWYLNVLKKILITVDVVHFIPEKYG